MGVKIAAVSSLVVAMATVYLPGDRGTQIAHSFEVQFKRLTHSERADLVAWNVAGKRPAPADGSQDADKDAEGLVPFGLRELCDATVAGWGGMLDEAGQPVPYSHTERRAAEEAYPGIEAAMVVAWYDTMWVNQREAKEKNSVPPSPNGSVPAAASGSKTS